MTLFRPLAALAAIALSLSACAAGNEMANSMVTAPTANIPAQSEALQRAWDYAESKSDRPGDAAMTCTQLDAEQTAVLHDPTVIGTLERIETRNRNTMATGDAARATNSAVYAGRVVLGQINLLGNNDLVNLTAAVQSRGAAARADLVSIMPAYARAIHLSELGQAKSCLPR